MTYNPSLSSAILMFGASFFIGFGIGGVSLGSFFASMGIFALTCLILSEIQSMTHASNQVKKK